MTQCIDCLMARRAAVVCGPINLHAFGGPDNPVDKKSGDATSIGDIVLRAKYHLHKGPVADIAGALWLKLPTGDEDNFLGTGTTTLRPFLIVSRTFFDVFTPHLNLGYEIDFDRGHQDALHYILGFETGIEKFSVVVDLLGKYKPNGNGVGDHTLTGSFGGKWNPFKQFVMFLNFQVPLNEQGLRSNLITTVGAEYTF
jgi:Putative MetA-pathway of phenol degradation